MFKVEGYRIFQIRDGNKKKPVKEEDVAEDAAFEKG
jgi:hypothetical protein